MKILLKNVSRGWFSLATHKGVRIELKVNATKVLDIEDDKLKYYKQFIPLGIAIEVLKEAEHVEEQPKIDAIHIDDMVEQEVREEGINKIESEHEGLVAEDLAKLTKAQLRDLCTSLNINWHKSMLKQDLINLLLAEHPEGE